MICNHALKHKPKDPLPLTPLFLLVSLLPLSLISDVEVWWIDPSHYLNKVIARQCLPITIIALTRFTIMKITCTTP